MTQFERNTPDNHPELVVGALQPVELSPDDRDDLLHLALAQNEYLAVFGEPSEIEMTAYGIPLAHGDQSSSLYGTVWNRYDTLAVETSQQGNRPLEAALTFTSPQKSDGSTLKYNSDFGLWSMQSHYPNQPARVITHDDVLEVLSQKMPENPHILALMLQKTELTSDKLVMAMSDILAPYATHRTEHYTYEAVKKVENDAYMCRRVARYSRDEGAVAIDHKISMEVQGIPVVPFGRSHNSDPSYLTHTHEFIARVPYNTALPELTEASFGITSSDISLDQAYLDALTRAEIEQERTSDALRIATAMLEEKHADFPFAA